MKRIIKYLVMFSIIASLFGCSPTNENSTDENDMQLLMDDEKYDEAYQLWKEKYSSDSQLQNEIILNWQKTIINNKSYALVDKFIQTIDSIDNKEYIEAIKTCLDNLETFRLENSFTTCFKLLLNEKAIYNDNNSTYLECLKTLIYQMFSNYNTVLSLNTFVNLKGFNVILDRIENDESLREYFLNQFIIYLNNNDEITDPVVDNIVIIIIKKDLFTTEQFDQFSAAFSGKISPHRKSDINLAYEGRLVIEENDEKDEKQEPQDEWYSFIYTNDEGWAFFRDNFVKSDDCIEGYLYSKNLTKNKIYLISSSKTDIFMSYGDEIIFISEGTLSKSDRYGEKIENIFYDKDLKGDALTCYKDYIFFVVGNSLYRIDSNTKEYIKMIDTNGINLIYAKNEHQVLLGLLNSEHNYMIFDETDGSVEYFESLLDIVES